MPMVRTDRFLISKALYLVAADHHVSIRRDFDTPDGRHFDFVTCRAISVRRKNGVVGVNVGSLGGLQQVDDEPASWDRLVTELDPTGGSTPWARWTGDSLWVAETVSEAKRRELVELLDPVLTHVRPLIEARKPVTPPPGWDGWWQLVARWKMPGYADHA